MKPVCATFEEWYLGDGVYPPLHRGAHVNLSFSLSTYEKTFSDTGEPFFNPSKNSGYEFSGLTIRDYHQDHNRIIIVDTGEFMFYVELASSDPKSLTGKYINGKGLLSVDYFVWVENLHTYADAPDIFYNFRVDKIRKVNIPEKFIHRYDNGFSSPASLSAEDYGENDEEEIEDMTDERSDTCFFLLGLHPITEQIAKTFT